MTKKLNLTGGNWKEFETDKPFHPYHDRAWRIFSSHAGGELRGIAAEVYKKEDAAMMAASKAMYEALESIVDMCTDDIEFYLGTIITNQIIRALKQARGEHEK